MALWVRPKVGWLASAQTSHACSVTLADVGLSARLRRRETTLARIRGAIALRYRLLPYIYTLFWRAHVEGLPVMRPMWFECPKDLSVAHLDSQFMSERGGSSRDAPPPAGVSLCQYVTRSVPDPQWARRSSWRP